MSDCPESSVTPPAPTVDFIREIINKDIASGKYTPQQIQTRFPPEPNGYLHIGHAKAICVDFGIAKDYGGKCNLRMDDTNPGKEDVEYVDSIKEDIQWLGYQWNDTIKFASDYFPQMYEYALQFIKLGLAYVDDQTSEEIRKTRGTLTEPGVNSPWRDRSIDENLDLFIRMKNGEFSDGEKVLRAKIDMAHANINFRDPIMYRILHAEHHRTGNKWCIYPMYDWAHGIEDSIEKVTHSLCTLEFEIHRPLYNWFLQPLKVHQPQQIEFSRLNLNHTVMSKRKLLKLVKENFVSGWDDPRMPTLCGLRRCGYTPEAIRDFVTQTGITKFNGITDVAVLENCLRKELNKTASRFMGILHPLKVTITNYPKDQTEYLDAVNNPENPEAGSRKLPFSREIYIDQDDFKEVPPPKYFRLTINKEVRLRWGFFITCQKAIKNEAGEVIELECTYDPATRGGNSPDGRKVKGTIHWVEAKHAVNAKIRLYDRLFQTENPDICPEGQDFTSNLNPDSLAVLSDCKIESAASKLPAESRIQFERVGYFCADRYDHSPEHPVFNRTVALRDSWAKQDKKNNQDKNNPQKKKNK
ncbi:MAG: glutamine--tRNA ligase/YqeY domain fusion protein [Lentisphaeria bacterium]